jgi:hypothetical protein
MQSVMAPGLQQPTREMGVSIYQPRRTSEFDNEASAYRDDKNELSLHPPSAEHSCTWCGGGFRQPNAQYGRGESVHMPHCPHCGGIN